MPDPVDRSIKAAHDKVRPFAEKVAKWLLENGDAQSRMVPLEKAALATGAPQALSNLQNEAEAANVDRDEHPENYNQGMFLGVPYSTPKSPEEQRMAHVDQAIATLKRAQEIRAKQDRLKAGEQAMEYRPAKER